MKNGRNRVLVGMRHQGMLHHTLLLSTILAAGCLDTFGYADSGQDTPSLETVTQALPTSGAPDTATTADSTANSADTSTTTSAADLTSASNLTSDGGVDSTTSTANTMTSPETSGTTGNSPGFFFADDDFAAYTQIDRHGAVEAGTIGIRAAGGLGFNGENIAIRDNYNASNPTQDAAMMWLNEISESIMFFHDDLDDDILGLGLTPATFNESIMQIGPVILPDTLKYTPSYPTSYPNGRKLTDPVFDITLAAMLLDLTVHPLDTIAQIPMNPPENDVPFATEFPFLAPPH